MRYVNGPEVNGFHEGANVCFAAARVERTYAVTATKKCVECAAGTRDADETFTERPFLS